MNKLLIIGVLLAGSNAFACPELIGKWSCVSTDVEEPTYQVEIKAIDGGIKLLDESDDDDDMSEMYLDGRVRKVKIEILPGLKVPADLKSQLTCKGKNGAMDVTLDYTAKIPFVGTKTYRTISNTKYAVEGNTLTLKGESAEYSKEGDKFVEEEDTRESFTDTCKKI